MACVSLTTRSTCKKTSAAREEKQAGPVIIFAFGSRRGRDVAGAESEDSLDLSGWTRPVGEGFANWLYLRQCKLYIMIASARADDLFRIINAASAAARRLGDGAAANRSGRLPAPRPMEGNGGTGGGAFGRSKNAHLPSRARHTATFCPSSGFSLFLALANNCTPNFTRGN